MERMKIYFVAIFAVILTSCGTETEKPHYSRQIKKWIDIQYLTYHGSWQGVDGFPVTGHSLQVLPTRDMKLIDRYALQEQWQKPWDVFLAVAGDKDTIAVKYYNRVDIYTNGQGSTVLSYDYNRRIADLWFADESLVVLWNDVNYSMGGFDTWNYGANAVKVGIDIWNPTTKTTVTTLDIPYKKTTPFLQHTIGGYPSLFNPVCRDKNRVFINDGKTVSLYSINGDKIQVVYEVEGEIWKCVVDGDKLLLEDRVPSIDIKIVHNSESEKVIPIPR